MKSRIIAGIVLLLVLCSNSFAQSLAFASGEKGKGYSKIFANVNDVCNASVPLKEFNTGGGLDNLTVLADKGATVGLSQIDTWQSLSNNGDEAIGRLKGVISLNSNLLHIIVQQAGFQKQTGTQCSVPEVFGKCAGTRTPVFQAVVITKDTDLKGLTVAAVGSAQLLARTYLSKKLELELDVKDVDAAGGKSGDALAIEMLKTGKVQAVITMAAYPSGPVSAIKQADGLSLANFTKQVSGGYKVVKKNYKGMGAFNVPFLAVPNILWARPVDPNGPIGQQISGLKACITANLKRFQDEDGFEPSWADATLVLPDDIPAWTGKAPTQASSLKKK